MSANELVDQVTEQDEIIGPIAKGKAHDEGLWHRAAHVWIYSDDGHVLIQRRAGGSSGHIGLLDISAAGHIQAGRTPEEGACDELQEELNVAIETTELELAEVMKVENPWPQRNTTHREFYYVYFLKLDRQTEFTFTDGEVEKVTWMPFATFASVLNDKDLRSSFVPHQEPYLAYVIEALEERINN